METLWDSINLALYVALLVAAVVALHTRASLTRYRLRSVTTTLNAKRERNSSTTLTIANKHSGYVRQLPYATYATYPSNQETASRQIMSMQETQTHNYSQHTDAATRAEATPPSPSTHTHSPSS